MTLQIQQQQQAQIQAVLQSTDLGTDGNSVIYTYKATITKDQITQQLTQAQAQLSQLNQQLARVQGNIESLTAQLALFNTAPVNPVNITPVTP